MLRIRGSVFAQNLLAPLIAKLIYGACPQGVTVNQMSSEYLVNPAPRRTGDLEINQMMDIFFMEVIYPAPQKVTDADTWLNPNL